MNLAPAFLKAFTKTPLPQRCGTRGLSVVQQAPINVHFRGILVGEFKADLFVEGRIIVELKAVSQLGTAHEVQLINYLKATGIPVGLLFNFGPRPQFKRRVFDVLAHPRSSASIRVKDNV